MVGAALTQSQASHYKSQNEPLLRRPTNPDSGYNRAPCLSESSSLRWPDEGNVGLCDHQEWAKEWDGVLEGGGWFQRLLRQCQRAHRQDDGGQWSSSKACQTAADDFGRIAGGLEGLAARRWACWNPRWRAITLDRGRLRSVPLRLLVAALRARTGSTANSSGPSTASVSLPPVSATYITSAYRPWFLNQSCSGRRSAVNSTLAIMSRDSRNRGDDSRDSGRGGAFDAARPGLRGSARRLHARSRPASRSRARTGGNRPRP